MAVRDSQAVLDMRKKVLGISRTGYVTLRDFDCGVVETMGSVVVNENYWLTVPGIDPPPGVPGIFVTFANPEPEYEKYRIPMVLVRRSDISPAMQRWHPGLGQYRVPAPEALPVTVQLRNGTTVSGYDRYEETQQACPFDISYDIEITARHRGDAGVRNQANLILAHLLKVYPPYCRVLLKDSIGDVRSYDAFMESMAVLDEVVDVADRQIGFSMSLRVEGELDVSDPEVTTVVTSPANVRMHMR